MKLLNQRSLCIIYMTFASSCHYIGYEFARAGTFALFTSPRHGFANGWAVSLATACISPCSMLLLYMYTKLYDAYGPRRTLKITCVAFAAILFIGGIVLSLCIEQKAEAVTTLALSQTTWSTYLTRVSLFSLFTIQNSMVYLLSTQHWSFLGSVVTSPTQTSWIAGVGSIFSTMGGMIAGRQWFGADLTKLLLAAGGCLLASAWCGDESYRIAENEGLLTIRQDASSKTKKSDEKMHSLSLIQRALALFRRVPVLGRLCLEVFCYQSQSSLLNYLYVVAVKDTLKNDMDRAKHTASTYALINFASGLLQFLCLPMLSWLHIDYRFMWVGVPSIMTAAAIYMAMTQDWSLWLVSASFVTMKTLEYSLRHSMIESVYVLLDYESRFVGKEIIAMFANRFGKSLVALVLTLVSVTFNDSSLPYIQRSLLLLCVTWLMASYRLVQELSRNRLGGANAKKD
ncbi:hypothetical protein MPSEU_000162900 [Mayamaea pseudoterrestris]|nr:hypothetical protein MPSEU_000162900 [Mayamaea pseudoterrestris]